VNPAFIPGPSGVPPVSAESVIILADKILTRGGGLLLAEVIVKYCGIKLRCRVVNFPGNRGRVVMMPEPENFRDRIDVADDEVRREFSRTVIAAYAGATRRQPPVSTLAAPPANPTTPSIAAPAALKD
jgi:hypothetical protein